MPPRPPISPEKRKERYLEAVRDKMAKLYAYGEAKPPAREQLWHEITGFLEAGQLLGNVTTEELQAIIDEEHIKAFGSDLMEPFDPISKRHFSAGDLSSLTC